MKYRPDIDGLRAIAVISVVLFHAGVSMFPGGYIGVDVFFVISGYLITSIIVSEIDLHSFSIVVFYERRIRRIFPALIAVIAFCLVVGFALLAPKDYRNLGESILATAAFISNIFFWQKIGYFDTLASEKPLLHTWSLSIEEQFYLVYPVCLIVLSRFSRAIRILAVAAALFCSFVLCAVLIYFKPGATFYLGQTRAWELLFGGLIALGAVPASANRIVTLGVAASGLALILLPIFLYSSSTRFPGITALPPVLGAGLLIWSGLRKPTVLHELLATTPMKEVGKASYSLYLWHFPILAFAGYTTLSGLNLPVALSMCLLSLVIAFASLHFIERPFRFPSRKSDRRRIAAFAVGSMAIVASAGATVVLKNGLPFRLTTTAAAYLNVEDEEHTLHRWECMSLDRKIVPPAKACILGTPGVPPTALLWGDSHSVVTASALEQAALRNGTAFLFAASADCPIGIDFSIYTKIGPAFLSMPSYEYCGQYNAEMLKLAIENLEIKAVVLSSRWTNWRVGEQAQVDIRLQDATGIANSGAGNRDIFARGFEKLLQALSATGKTIWIVGPLPEPFIRVPRALYIQSFGFDRTELAILRASFAVRHQFILSLFESMGKKYPINFIWPHTLLCGETTCPVVEHGNPLYFDHNHLSLRGVTKTSPLYDEIFTAKSPYRNRPFSGHDEKEVR